MFFGKKKSFWKFKEAFLGKKRHFGGFLVSFRFLVNFWVSKLYERFEEDEYVISIFGQDIRSCVELNWFVLRRIGDDSAGCIRSCAAGTWHLC